MISKKKKSSSHLTLSSMLNMMGNCQFPVKQWFYSFLSNTKFGLFKGWCSVNECTDGLLDYLCCDAVTFVPLTEMWWHYCSPSGLSELHSVPGHGQLQRAWKYYIRYQSQVCGKW